jgi:hypothetical protein
MRRKNWDSFAPLLAVCPEVLPDSLALELVQNPATFLEHSPWTGDSICGDLAPRLIAPAADTAFGIAARNCAPPMIDCFASYHFPILVNCELAFAVYDLCADVNPELVAGRAASAFGGDRAFVGLREFQ